SIIQGASNQERWAALSPTSGTATLGGSITARYVHQYMLGIAYSVIGGGSPASPTLTYSAVGAAASSNIGGQASLWMDSGSGWSIPSIIQGASNQERWAALSPTSGTAT